MGIVKWEDKYSVGIESMDSQHKKIIQLINNVFDELRGEGKHARLMEIIDGLVDYTHVHFKSEETIFEKFGYSETEEHKAEHKKFITQLADFKKGFEEGKIPLTMDIVTFLEDWLFSHILGTDQKYTKFFKANGVS